MGYGVYLDGLPLGVAQIVGAGAADGVQRIPELRGAAHVGHVSYHAEFSAVSYFPEHLAAELDVVALLVDGIGASSFY